MFYRSVCAFSLSAITLLTLPVQAQSVISTHSGIVYFFEGSVYLGDQVLQPHPGKFSSVPPGAELRTAEGRAEVLLTPGVFVRIGARSAIRMVANELSDTRVELLAGSALVDSAEPNSGTSVTLIYKNWSVLSTRKTS
jgi:ferric-dicitrate binding protein FerR (iron transport regulator)